MWSPEKPCFVGLVGTILGGNKVGFERKPWEILVGVGMVLGAISNEKNGVGLGRELSGLRKL